MKLLAHRPRGFSWTTILKYGLVGSGLCIGLHLLFYATGGLLSPWGPMGLLFSTYLLLIVLGLVGMMRLGRRRTQPLGFLGGLVHTLAFWAMVGLVFTAWDFTFQTRIEPNYTVRILEHHIAQGEEQYRLYTRQMAAGDTIVSLESYQKLRTDLDARRDSARQLRASPPTLPGMLQQQMPLFLLFGLLWGALLGYIVRNLTA